MKKKLNQSKIFIKLLGRNQQARMQKNTKAKRKFHKLIIKAKEKRRLKENKGSFKEMNQTMSLTA